MSIPESSNLHSLVKKEFKSPDKQIHTIIVDNYGGISSAVGSAHYSGSIGPGFESEQGDGRFVSFESHFSVLILCSVFTIPVSPQ